MGSKTKNSFLRQLRNVLLLLLALLALVLFEPHLFRAVIRECVILKAARHGVLLQIGDVEGNLFNPLVFKEIEFSTSRASVETKVSIKSARVVFSSSALLLQRGRRFFDRLTLDTVNADVSYEPYGRSSGPEPTPAELELIFRPWLPAPTRMEVCNSNFVFHPGNRTVTFEDVRFSINLQKPGNIAIEKLTLEQSGKSRTFTILRGTTAVQDSHLRIAGITLCDSLRLNSISCDFDDLMRGQLQVEFDFTAFGGSLRGELLNAALGRRPTYEITGYFSNISVEALGKFLNAPEKTGGTIKEGKFTFRGSLHELENATVSTRFEATDFRWGARQWNSLVLGATVLNRRVQIPDFELQQAHNSLKLKGEIGLPTGGSKWWLSDFNLDVAARIDNLAELSALLGPKFADTAGKMTLDGSIRCDNKSYSGQLLVAGTKLAWRGVPFDQLNAGIKLDGNELQIVNLELARGSDFLRGKGFITILGERRYQGEVNASVEELAAYAPLLQKPIVPAPPSGGLVVNWSGDGTTGVHNGAFTAHFRKLRTTGSLEVPATLPIDAEIEGTYAPGGLSLGKCILANEETRLETRISADDKMLKLEGIKLTQKKTPWLEGNATLPFNIFQWWVSPGIDAFAPDAPFKAQITANGVQLEDVAHLTGRPIPIRGLLSGSLKTESTLRDLRMTGSLKLTKGQLPASDWIPALDKLEADAEIDGNVLRFNKFGAHHSTGDFSATGSLDFTKFESPIFDLLVHGEKIHFDAGSAWQGSANLDLTVTGTRDNASVTGAVNIAAFDVTPHPRFGALIVTGDPETIRVPSPAIILKTPFDRWRFDVRASTPEPLKIKEGTVAADLRLSGSGSPLKATGCITLAGLPAGTFCTIAKLDSGTWHLGNDTSVVAHVSGKYVGEKAMTGFDAYYLGSPEKLSMTYHAASAQNAEMIVTALTPGVKAFDSNFTKLQVDVGPMVYNPKVAAEIAAKEEPQPASFPDSSPAP